VLRRIFGHKERGSSRRLEKTANEELHNVYTSPNIIPVINQGERCAWHVARMGEMRNAYNILVGKPEGKRPLRRRRRGWEDNIRMDLRKIGWENMNSIHLA
jgi:hypothetical protein